jgi:hypothetical protein
MAFIPFSSQLIWPLGCSSSSRRCYRIGCRSNSYSTSCNQTGRSISFASAVDSSSTIFRLVQNKNQLPGKIRKIRFFFKLLLFAGLDSQSLSISRIDSPCTYPPSLLSLCCSAPTCSVGGVYIFCCQKIWKFNHFSSPFFYFSVCITVLVSGVASASAGRTNASSWSRRKCSS